MSDPFMPIDLRQINSAQTDRSAQKANNASDKALEGQANKLASSSDNATNKAVSPDTLELSAQSQLVGSLISKISAQPEVNQTRVEQLRTSIASGEYTVSPDKIASKLLTLDFGLRNHD